MSKDTGGPAFPSHGSMGEVVHEGATLRDYFAAKAIAAIISETGVNYLDRSSDFVLDAKLAYAYADAMLAERSKP